MNDRQKNCSCEDCKVDFSIRVDGIKDNQTVERTYRSIKWLNNCALWCPACGNPLVVTD